MPEPTIPITVAIKGGAMLATGSMMAELVIFNDELYKYLALVGAIVSMFGVLHEVLRNRPIQHTPAQILAEIIKGLVLGVLAIPLFYLVLSEGGEPIIEKLFGVKVGGVGNSVWLIISFAMSWYTVPIFNWTTSKIRVKAKNV